MMPSKHQNPIAIVMHVFLPVSRCGLGYGRRGKGRGFGGLILHPRLWKTKLTRYQPLTSVVAAFPALLCLRRICGQSVIFMPGIPLNLKLALLSAAVLGFRHGFDYDHIAAITDITSVQKTRARAMQLGLVYALGDAAMVLGLGAAVIFF